MYLPIPSHERARIEEGELRMSLLEGRWDGALRERMGRFFAESVRDRISSAVDMSRAPFKYAIDALNLLYLDAPTVAAGDADLSPLSGATLWPIRHQAHRIVLGLGECLIRWDVSESGGARRLTHRLVLPHRTEVITDPRDQFKILVIREMMEVPQPDGRHCLYRETHDARPEAPTPYMVEEWVSDESGAHQWVDVTAEQTRGLEGGVPYRDSAGAQIIPYAIHHQYLGSHTWQWRVWSELVAAQLHSGCLQTWLLAGIRDNAYPTRVAIDLDIPSGTVIPEGSIAGQGGSAYITIEPSTILRMRTANTATGTGSIATLAATMDPAAVSGVIASYVEQALQDAGLGPADEAPAKGVSGHAISISRDALRRSQRQQIPAARLGDQVMLALGARLANRYLGTALPEDPAAYSLSYHGIPLSTAEVQSTVDRVTRLLDAGLMTRAMALREVHPYLSEADANALADEIDEVTEEAAAPGMAEVEEADEVKDTAEVDTLATAESADTIDQAQPITSPEAAAVVASGASVSDTALNGAQVTALVEVLAQVAARTLAPDAAILVLIAAFPTIDEATAREMVAAQGRVPAPAPVV